MLLASSCKTKKLLQQPTLEKKSTQELVEQFLQQPDYEFIEGKAKVNFSSTYGSGRGTLYLRTIKDSIIWMAVKKLSVEAGRVLITQDSVFMINRLEKSYQKHALASIHEKYGLPGNFAYIQSLILGLTPAIDTTQFWELDSSDIHLNIKTSVGSILHKFIIDNESGYVLGGTFKDQFTAEGAWQYEDYIFQIAEIPVPGSRSYNISLAENEDPLKMKINFSELEVDNPKSIRFSIPSHYTRTY